MRNAFLVLATAILISSCGDDNEEPISYRPCNDRLSSCFGSSDGEYCTFGYKWGDNNPFAVSGIEADGPKLTGGTITYSFQEAGVIFNTHSQSEVISSTLDLIMVCSAREQVNRALLAWQAVADLVFEEVGSTDQSDLRFFAADIEQGGLGYPNYDDDFCRNLAGQVIFDVPTGRQNCDQFYNLALHEIGHALGLGHVSSDNIMSTNFSNDVTELQPGDVAGIRSIYGE
ncbi:matrixin family metalloprotease [Neolewinella antarctica]|uniref:Peptidase metallopeptidase domain-containing protein n=1 Tax=Neolewinella antarctica TaxID=442734 RepID=A0ABX0X7L6_9BACT|nr:matrixin family metalloprotease [Neolewinella antarctica]NJC24858.1 hypothetical protein [Neolewinella antarctica]